MDHPHFSPIALAEVQVIDFPELDLSVAHLIVKLQRRFLGGAQRPRLLEDFHPFLFEHHDPLPPQFLHRLQKRTLHIPTING